MTDKAKGISRRRVIKGLGATLGAAAFGAALSPLFQGGFMSAKELMQRHYKELSPEDKKEVLERLQADAKETFGRDVTIADPRPRPKTKFVYAINLSLCNGSGKCVEACHKENNHDRITKQSYIRVLEMPKGTMDMERGNTTYNHTVPAKDKFYMPVQCQQCDEPPCVDVCPVQATWKEKDGIVVVDYNWCIGCRYCMAACPYHARRFNWKKPYIPPEDINPNQGYLSNRVRQQGVVEKCHYCLHRTREGRLPACLEACPTGARVFGNFLDPKSSVRWVFENKRVYVLKEELGTKPSFFYFFDK
ncbi:MAG: 4Fe-4S dicluster domain-containing protein [Planctomycetes bacterium]|jgi:molybdopterin-containing oxidoreductase family iron-sulfur binding subunit|nr:4Fe-4S dicluster domain-containing protein [Planctomycetota bacterium]MBT6969322.1 4Fe-4S dicluster domain-containing protein [Planctomycetota bacterium]MBT7103804.1 4Fe-4S dicluster domain-containing protein [Planctomycetota bacterium]HIG05153.1 4Fe-4S dicluster domain-containing protein [Planctomycetota bacterium]